VYVPYAALWQIDVDRDALTDELLGLHRLIEAHELDMVLKRL